MKYMLVSLVFFLSIVCVASPGHGCQVEMPEMKPKQEKIRHLLDLIEAADQADEILDIMINSLKPTIPEASEDLWVDIRQEFDTNALIEMIIPIYDKHLTEQEVDDLIEFYSSPTGRSFIGKQTLIFQESFAAGESWGREIAERLIKKIETRKKEPKVVGR